MTETTLILPHKPTREAILRLEAAMRKYPQLELPPKHHFAHGLYARELFIPAGTILTGKVHRFEHLNIVSQGDITVWTEDGIKRVQAPFTMVSRAGTKRVGYTHADTIWTTIHAISELTERDLGKIEAELIVPEGEFLEFGKFLEAVK